jgi:hypothetical protein
VSQDGIAVSVTSAWSITLRMDRWQPGFHDDFFFGWFIAVSYLAGAIVAALLATFLNQMEERKACKLWFLISLLMLFLGINKQLDLQRLFADIGRQVAFAQGWYHQRRVVQFTFIIIFAASFTLAFIWITKTNKELFRRYKLAFFGLFSLLSFVIIRASAFHHFEELIGYDINGIKMNWVLELVGIYMIILAGLKAMISSRIRKP